MLFKRELFCVILCNLVRLGWTAEADGAAHMPTVMEAIVHVMIDFRRVILDNLQLSLEFHTEQLNEINIHMEQKVEKLEKEMETKFEKLREEMQRLFDKSSSQIQEVDKTVDVINIRSLFGGGWTVFQRRIDGSVDFYRNWTMYKHGFGDINGEHWLGLEKLHAMTKLGRYELFVLLEDFEGNSTYALYDEFKIGSEEEKYKLTVGKYSGTAGDSLDYHNGMKFSTFDQDNDGYSSSCAKVYYGAWWFRGCRTSHLNGQYSEIITYQGVIWETFREYSYSLKTTTMMFRSRPSN
ncbi:AGAP012000-PA-like protein [Anopheles sinensis]|uniref:AGAP012000-PA-like protein n=1 Tax=Anopheles sinensis TaxID=74873 RepID=A0A084WET3_ANOSI|nr:AGAP012000-PA-like protein [Anopheles sinensis]